MRINDQAIGSKARTFATGSTGFSLFGKIALPVSADRLSLQTDGGIVTAIPRTFSTGSHGYMLTGKAVLDGKAVQVTGSAVYIGSKVHGRPQGTTAIVQVTGNAVTIGSKAAGQAARVLPSSRLVRK